jgi:hypothetical protein
MPGMREEGLLLPNSETPVVFLLVVRVSGLPDRWHDLSQIHNQPRVVVLCHIPDVHEPQRGCR